MSEKKAVITWTKTDEAPQLASFSLLPIVRAFLKHADVEIDVKDISLAGRILAQFGYTSDDLAYLGKLVWQPDCILIKLPNISASVPQLIDAIRELQRKGFNLPDYPEEPKTPEEEEIKKKYDACVGSVVNPVIRAGNSIRKIARPVKNYARKHPHKLKPTDPHQKSYVAYMKSGDFYRHEKSVVMDKDTTIKYIFVNPATGEEKVLKEIKVEKGDVIDGTWMNRAVLKNFFEEVIEDAKENDMLFSLHVKATMMRVSDPAIFGDAIRVYYKKLWEKHGDLLQKIGFKPEKGLVDLEEKMKQLSEEEQKAIKETLEEIYKERPRMYMVDSDRGITNLHRPNDVIIDNSVPSVIKNGLKAWGPKGEEDDVVITIPDRSYATMYDEIVEDVKVRGQFDPATVGSVENIGLMAIKAEEYGSHDKTFFPPAPGIVKIVDEDGRVLMQHKVKNAGDIYRSCHTKDIAIKNWIEIAVQRAKEASKEYNDTVPIVFWLDRRRAHDRELIKIVKEELAKMEKEGKLEGVDWYIMPPKDAMKFTLKRFREGKYTISVTGNVLRDYLTDLFPIIEVGTSARAQSIVPLLKGGILLETGAGGSAPRHVQQFLKETHLRWDSLGEYLALYEALMFAHKKTGNERARIMAEALYKAIDKYLDEDKTPKRKVGQLDTRGSHYYFARFWAEALAEQDEDKELKQIFEPIAKELKENEEKILNEIKATEGKPAGVDAWYYFDDEPTRKRIEELMRPSKTFNAIIEKLLSASS
jgi:isocitrate dehydrogenase